MSKRFRRITRRAQRAAAMLAVSVAVHVFMIHSSLLPGPSSGAPAPAGAPAAAAELPTTAGAEVGGDQLWRGGSIPTHRGADRQRDDLSQKSLNLVRRASEPSLDVFCTLTVPPPLSN